MREASRRAAGLHRGDREIVRSCVVSHGKCYGLVVQAVCLSEKGVRKRSALHLTRSFRVRGMDDAAPTADECLAVASAATPEVVA